MSQNKPDIACNSSRDSDFPDFALRQLLPLTILIVLVVVAYKPVLFDFFLGDDFVHLIWLKKAMLEPGLIVKNFYSNWLDITTTSFYRPLISVFMASDYYFGGANGLTFHLTNLFFHLVATTTIFFLGRDLYLDASSSAQANADAVSKSAAGANAYNDAGADAKIDADAVAGADADADAVAEADAVAGADADAVAVAKADADADADADSKTDIAGKSENFSVQNEAVLYGLVAAAIFGFYPLHSEAVAWITGRVDAVVTAFICLALLFYRRWRVTGSNIALIRTFVFLVAGLMSKEMAITLPGVFFAYSFWLEMPAKNKSAVPDSSIAGLFFKRIIHSTKASAPFFALLIFYFILRRIALGTFVGGYDNSLLPFSNLHHFLATWLHGIRMFLVPLNREVVASSDPLNLVLFATLPIMACLFVSNVLRSKTFLKLNLFNLSFIFFAFLPVYKLFAIANDLQGSRLAQVATVSLALLLASSYAPLKNEHKRFKVLKTVSVAIYLSVLFVGLRTNNAVWATAGHEVNSIRAALAKQYQSIDGDPQVLLLNLPDNIHGAYAVRNALDGITKAPQFPRDVYNCLMIGPYEPIIPFGFLSKSLVENRDKVVVLSWSEDKKVFEKLDLTQESGAISRSFAGSKLNSLIGKTGSRQNESDNNQGAKTDKERSKEERGNEETSHKEAPIEETGNQEASNAIHELSSTEDLEIDLNGLHGMSDLNGLNCQNVQIVEIHCSLNNPVGAGRESGRSTEERSTAVLHYTNQHHPEKNGQKSLVSPLMKPSNIYYFPLSSRPDWFFGGESRKLYLRNLSGKAPEIQKIVLAKKTDLMPTIDFENSGYLGSKGYMHLSSGEPVKRLLVDGSNVSGATSCRIIVSQPNKLFQTQNAAVPEANSLMTIEAPLNGSVEFKRVSFPSDGIYQVRCFSVDEGGNTLGLASDHIVISIDD